MYISLALLVTVTRIKEHVLLQFIQECDEYSGQSYQGLKVWKIAGIVGGNVFPSEIIGEKRLDLFSATPTTFQTDKLNSLLLKMEEK